MLKFKKVYIDSSYKVNGTSSDFTIDLPETVQLEDNMLCQIHEVGIPHSWYSVNDTNNNLYFRHQVFDWIWGIVWVWVSCTDVSQRLYLLAQVRGC